MIFEDAFVGTHAVSVVVTCHEDYLRYLPDQVSHVDSQTMRPVQRIIAYDGEDWETRVVALVRRYPGWQVVGGNWGSPNPARNKALALVESEWVVFADADDFMGERYCEDITRRAKTCGSRVAIMYAGLRYSNGKEYHVPEKFDYWTLRLRNFVSAAAAWRVSAVRDVGGFGNTSCYDDWGLALRITACGWKGVKIDEPICIRYHAGHRRDNAGQKEMAFKWTQRTYGIVTLLAGRRECFEDWIGWLRHAEMPNHVTLYLLDNSRDDEFGAMVRDAAHGLPYPSLYVRCDAKCGDTERDELARHRHVPNLYNRILPRITDDMVLTLEDDVLPPLYGFRQIVKSFICGQKTGAVSGVYPSRTGENRIVAAWGNFLDGRPENNYWRRILTYECISGRRTPLQVGFIGGGFVLWQNALVKRFLPMRFMSWRGKASGWDSNLSRDIRGAGYSLWIDPMIQCEHNYR